MKYIFFDYDGTLSSHIDFEMHEHTVKALKQCQANGHKIFLCTGRAPKFIFERILTRIPFDGFISCGGNYVYLNNELIDDNSIDPILLEKTVRLLNENEVYFSLETKDENYQTQDARNFWDEMNKKRFPDFSKDNKKYKNFTKFTIVDKNFDITGLEVGKIGFISPSIEKFEAITDQLSDFYINYPPHRDNNYIHGELTLKSCSKAHGMQVLLKAYNASIEDTIAFGDGGNDYPMIEFANIGIVHEKANERLKKLSKFTFEDEINDGITKALNQLNLI